MFFIIIIGLGMVLGLRALGLHISHHLSRSEALGIEFLLGITGVLVFLVVYGAVASIMSSIRRRKEGATAPRRREGSVLGRQPLTRTDATLKGRSPRLALGKRLPRLPRPRAR